jgi:hypothetical protein
MQVGGIDVSERPVTPVVKFCLKIEIELISYVLDICVTHAV